MNLPRPLRVALPAGLALLLAAAAVEALLLYLHAIHHAPVNTDAGYYLATVERYAEGWAPYRDLPLAYTPLGIHSLVGVRLLVGEPVTFALAATVVYLLHGIGALLTFSLARRLGAGRLESAGAGVLLLLVAYASQGVYIALEPFVVVFTLLAIHACLSASRRPGYLLLAGLAAGLAFLSKQYGLAASAPVGLFALATGHGARDRVRRGMLAAIGFALPVAVLLLAYRVALGVPPPDLVRGWGGGRYEWWGPAAALPTLQWLLWPWFLTLAFLPFTAWVRRRDPAFWLVVATAVVMLLPLLVRPYAHYLLLTLPFLCVLVALVVAWARRDARLTILVGTVAVVTLVLVARAAYRDFRHHREGWDRASQEREAEGVNEYVPRGSAAQVLGDEEQWLYHLADLHPVLPRERGYSFPSLFDDARTARQIEHAPAVIGRTKAIDTHPRARELLRANGFVRVALVGEDLEIHRRPR